MKRIILAIALLTVTFLSVLVYLISVGSTYTVYRDRFEGFNENDYIVSIQDNNIVSFDGVEYTDDHIGFRFKSVSKGRTDVVIDLKESSKESFEKANPQIDLMRMKETNHFYVGSFNQMVVEVNYGTDFNGWQSICFGVGLYFLVITVYLFVRLRRRYKVSHEVFSYKTILNCGYFLASLGVTLMMFAAAFSACVLYDFYTVRSIFMFLNYTSAFFVVLSIPFVFVFSVAMTLSNLSLIRHEGMRITNLLGIGISAALFAMILGMGRVSYMSSSIYYIDTYNVYATFVVYFECLLLGTMICALTAVKRKIKYDKDYIIILGCGINRDGSPTPLLKGRVDKAIEFYNAQLEKTGKKAVFVPSGGQGGDEVISESESMKRYLVEKGIPEEQIMTEDKSTNTLENMMFSKKLIDEKNKNAKVVFSTTNYHVFRSGMLSVQAGLNADGIGSKTKWYFWPNALIREFVGLVAKSWRYELTAFLLVGLVAMMFSFFSSNMFIAFLGV